MTDQIDTTPEAVGQHLDISHNHEAGLIPMSTQTMLRALSARIAELEANLSHALESLSLIAVVGQSDDPKVNAAIARQTVTQARDALAEIKGETP